MFGLAAAIDRRHNEFLFNWMLDAFAYQGISDRAADGYMARHGHVMWRAIAALLDGLAPCPKLQSYWTFRGCGFSKTRRRCLEQRYFAECPLPRHDLRNDRLNQLAYSFYLFVRDVAENNLIGWIDNQVKGETTESLLGSLRNIFGVSDIVLSMTLSQVLLAAPGRTHWRAVGCEMVTINTLVHNFLC